ncbi:MAG: RidA family protein, partial [Akkermansiaceae bacterium]|nr:RidA family protein [Akkermansiaceae bacterium]
MSAEQRLRDLGLTLPEVPAPVGSYVNCVRSGQLVHTSGGLPFDGERRFTGKVPTDLSIEDGQEASRLVVLNRLAVIREELGSLD